MPSLTPYFKNSQSSPCQPDLLLISALSIPKLFRTCPTYATASTPLMENHSLYLWKILIHTYISSFFDCCNSLLQGLVKCLLSRLQLVENAATCLLKCIKKHNYHLHLQTTLLNLHSCRDPIQKTCPPTLGHFSNTPYSSSPVISLTLLIEISTTLKRLQQQNTCISGMKFQQNRVLD